MNDSRIQRQVFQIFAMKEIDAFVFVMSSKLELHFGRHRGAGSARSTATAGARDKDVSDFVGQRAI
jgi:hypothetical protein